MAIQKADSAPESASRQGQLLEAARVAACNRRLDRCVRARLTHQAAQSSSYDSKTLSQIERPC